MLAQMLYGMIVFVMMLVTFIAVQHSVQLTVGGLRVFQLFSWLRVFSVSTVNLHPHPPPLTHTVGLLGIRKN